MLKDIFGSPLESYRNARKPGGLLAPSENFRGFLTSDAANIASKILGGTPIAQALFEGPMQAEELRSSFKDREFKDKQQEFAVEQMKFDRDDMNAVRDFRNNMQDPNFDFSKLSLSDLSLVDTPGVISALTAEVMGDNLMEAYSLSEKSVVFASPLDIKNNPNIIPYEGSPADTSGSMSNLTYRAVVRDPQNNEHFVYSSPEGKTLVDLDGTLVPYSNDMFGEGTDAQLSTVGGLSDQRLDLGSLLKIKSSIEEDEVQLERLATFIQRVDDLPSGMNKIVNELNTVVKTIVTENNLTPEEFNQQLAKGTFQGLIGANRLAIVGGGVMTEQDAVRIMLALGGDPSSMFTNKQVASRLIGNILADKYKRYSQNLEVYNNEAPKFSGYGKKEGFTLTEAQKQIFDPNIIAGINVDDISTMSREQVLLVDPLYLDDEARAALIKRYETLDIN
tara:strand:- start:1730 stop:3073 length:1344 start_codon:yes stop_codon:yes gene_type:complete